MERACRRGAALQGAVLRPGAKQPVRVLEATYVGRALLQFRQHRKGDNLYKHDLCVSTRAHQLKLSQHILAFGDAKDAQC
jgi:hypothetical protein